MACFLLENTIHVFVKHRLKMLCWIAIMRNGSMKSMNKMVAWVIQKLFKKRRPERSLSASDLILFYLREERTHRE